MSGFGVSLAVAFRVVPCHWTCAEQGDQVACAPASLRARQALQPSSASGFCRDTSQPCGSSAEVNGGESVLQSQLPLGWGPWPSVQFVSSDRGVGSSHRACAVKTSQCLLPKGSVHPRPRARPTEENKAKQTGALALTAKLRQGQAGLLLPRAQHSSQKVFVALFC